MSERTPTYRFDDDYETAYKWNGEAYICIGNYVKFGIKADMAESQKTEFVDEYLDKEIDSAFDQ